MKLVLASRNAGKVAELKRLLDELDVEVLSLSDYPEAPHIVEDGATFEENAGKKAVGIAQFTGLHAVADDSGLCVDALGGRPGIYSARYAGRGAGGSELCKKLLREMRRFPDEKRTAHFECRIVLAGPDGEVVLSTEGICCGAITRQMRGGRGFGYDPVFLHPPSGKTFAQMNSEEKNRHSHRGEAMRKLREELRKLL